MLRQVAAVLIGILIGSALNMGLIELNSSVLFPAPEGLDLSDPDQFNAYIAGLPTLAFLVVLVAHLGQAFVGGLVAARLAASHPMTLALVVGVVSLAGGIAAMTMIDGPDWLIIELPLYIVAAWCAGHLEVKRRAG